MPDGERPKLIPDKLISLIANAACGSISLSTSIPISLESTFRIIFPFGWGRSPLRHSLNPRNRRQSQS